ncbi:MAG TPA: nitrilase-related carbon-nitrogen hydrolase [Ktedonobacteraceae bacterium]|nr:nitrilase-related carbon-nitrogen hydrolase [Ktedonobacteraceae bacterium]
MKKLFSAQQAGSTERLRFLWLILGLLYWLFATNGRLDIPLAAWLSPLFLLRFTRTMRPLSGFLWVWLAGLIVTIFWLYESSFYDTQQVFSVINLVLLAIFLFSFTLMALPYLLDRLLAPRLGLLSGLLATLVFPSGQVCFEYLRAHVAPYGFFFSPAYTQYENLPLIQIVSITGVYGLSFLIAWFASVSNGIWEQHFSWPRIRGSVLLYSSVLVLVLLFGGARLAFSVPPTQTIRVAGVSATRATYEQARSVDGGADRALASSIFTTATNELLDASRREARAGAKIIVWPELATYTFSEDETALIRQSQSLANTEHIYLEIAYGVYSQQEISANRAVLIDPQGKVLWTYDKAHPGMTMPTVKDGPGIVPVVDTSYGRLASVICIDAWYSDLMRQTQQRH